MKKKSDPNNNNNNGPANLEQAIMKYRITSNQLQNTDSTSNNNDNDSQSTAYGGMGATPNVASTSAPTHMTMDINDSQNNKRNFAEELGPIVLNADGSISRIRNWNKLTNTEQEKVRVKITKRNAKRRQKLLQKEAETNQNDIQTTD
eukprot:131829_1